MKALKEMVEKLGLSLDEALYPMLVDYAEELCRWNARIRLVGPRDLETILNEQVLDALAFLLPLEAHAYDFVLDLGAGGGLPSLVLAMAYPELPLYMVEPIGKKVAFLEHMKRRHGLKQVKIHQGRYEEGGVFRPPFEGTSFTEDALGLLLSRATFSMEAWLGLAASWQRSRRHILLALADGEALEALSQEALSVKERRRWAYEIPSTLSPRTLVLFE